LPKSTTLRRDAKAIFQAALEAANAANAVRSHLSIHKGELRSGKLRLGLGNFDRIFLISIGKAAVDMARQVETIVGDRLNGGLVLTKYGHAKTRLRHLQVLESSHPVPDARGVEAAQRVREMLRELNARDLLLMTISGGASALLSAPVEEITLAAKQKTTDILLRAGADIFQLNAVRKHLSSLKGGQLAALAYPATVVSLLLSDVIGDPLDVIGSGPTAPDPSTFADALAVLDTLGVADRIPKTVLNRLTAGDAGKIAETPKPGNVLFRDVHNIVVGSNALALAAAAARAQELGYRPMILSTSMQGETRDVARAHAEILREAVLSGRPVKAPACLLSGGETKVTVKGRGKGGRNQEFALALALALEGVDGVLALCAGTDGTDGPTDAAGAIATGDSLTRSQRLGMDARKHLKDNNAYPFFAALGDLIKTGPTGTNVMDVNILLAG